MGSIAVRTELVRAFMVERIADVAVAAPATGDPLRHAGYRSRVAETEMFEPARAPVPGLADMLADGLEPVAERLAALEPFDRPDPASGEWTSWRVPGPGGHVRHYVAQECAERLGEEWSPAAKRRWMRGFYLRCCEEARG